VNASITSEASLRAGAPDSAAAQQIRHRIEAGTARVAVLALGYVGLPLLRTFHDAGYHVLGFDTDPEKIDKLERGECYLNHYGGDYVRPMVESGRFQGASDFRGLREADAILVCVPTPLDEHRQPDLSFVDGAADTIAAHIQPGQLVVLESTTYPGTTRERVLPRLDETGLEAGRDFFLAYSPEREDPGSPTHQTRTIPKLVGGADEVSGEIAKLLYQQAIQQVITVQSAEIAEAAKLLENIYRAVNIALVNEMKALLQRMGIDIWQVVEAAATKPFGFEPFYPGPGLGGHCIPIDPFYLTYRAREFGLPTRFIELAGEVNHEMPAYVINRITYALNEHEKPVRGSRILVLGLAYKPNVADVRESPSFALIEQLKKLGAQLDYHDPYVPRTHHMRHYGDLLLESISLDEKSLRSYDAVVVATHHDDYDWDWIASNARLVVDTRAVVPETAGCDVVKA